MPYVPSVHRRPSLDRPEIQLLDAGRIRARALEEDELVRSEDLERVLDLAK